MSRIKAKMVYKKIIEKQGKLMSVSAAMRAVGYSPSYSHNPQDFLSTKSAKELEKEYLPDELIALRHHELLNHGEIEHYLFPKIGSKKVSKKKGSKKVETEELTNDEIRTIVESVPGCRLIYVKRDFMGAWAFFQVPSGKIRKEAIDMAYKRKGTYAPEQFEITKRKFEGMTNAELAALIKKSKDFFSKK